MSMNLSDWKTEQVFGPDRPRAARRVQTHLAELEAMRTGWADYEPAGLQEAIAHYRTLAHAYYEYS